MKKICILMGLAIIIFVLLIKREKQVEIAEENENIKSTITMGLMGDLGLGRYITSKARSKNDFGWSFGGVNNWLSENDFNLANLESPIIKNCPEGKTGTFTFCGDERFLPELKKYNFVFNLANNHIFNYGENGFIQTKNFLRNNNINFYYGDLEIIESDNIKLGFLGYDLVTNARFNEGEIIDEIKNSKDKVDWLIVSIHWGNEYLVKPEQWRIDLAHKMIDNGVDIVYGHHPHVIQKEEIYKGKYIFYSLGNFVFDQNWSKETSNSEIVRLTVDKENILKMEKWPIEIKQNSRPEISE